MDELGRLWNEASPSVAAIATTSIILVSVTVFLIVTALRSSTSWKLKREGLPPVPPGSYGLPLIGETIQFALAQFNKAGTRKFVETRSAKYGRVFKTHILGGPLVVMDPPGGNKFLFQNEGKLVENSWPPSMAKLLGPGSMTMKTGDHYKICRRHFSASLDHVAVASYLPGIDWNAVNHFAKCWKGMEEVSALEMTKKFTFATISCLLLSLDEGPIMEELSANFTAWALGLLQLPLNIPGFPYHKALKARKRIWEILDEVIAQRREELAEGGESKPDLLRTLLTVADESGRMVTDEEIKDNILLLLFAGHDTSSHTLAMVITYIARNPHVEELLRKEHEAILKRKEERRESDVLIMEDINAMKYTWKVIQETLRLQPAVEGTFREAITDFEYNGYTIPKGWKLMWTNQYSHHDPEFFKNPDLFDPSRFEEVLVPNTYIPFGGGPRMCPGYVLAKVEMSVFVHHLLRNYRWALADPNEPIIRTPMPRTRKGTPIRITEI